jgi:2-oxo-3-hexenedioate decarboxylase
MTSRESLLHELAGRLDEAAATATPIAQLSAEVTLTLAEAYTVQALSVARRIARGEPRIGMKMGFTSRAKMAQMGVHAMIWGRLTRAMAVEEGGVVKHARFIHPRVEPEVAFLLKKRLVGHVTAPEALSAVEAVAPALELIDSRYRDFKFSLSDVVADNSSSSSFVLGPWQSPGDDFANLGLVLSINGEPKQIGSTAAILGSPLRSLVAAAALVAEGGETLEPGSIVMAGGATAAEPLLPGTRVLLEMERLGRMSFEIA